MFSATKIEWQKDLKSLKLLLKYYAMNKRGSRTLLLSLRPLSLRYKQTKMEKRIKIVWVLSLVSALVLIGVQGYWLFSQYHYVIGSQTETIARAIQLVGEEELAKRKAENGGSFSYSLISEVENDSLGLAPRKKTMMTFTTGKNRASDDIFDLADARERELRDSIMKIIKSYNHEQIRESGGIKIDLREDVEMELAKNGEELYARKGKKLSQKSFDLLFRVGMSEDSVVWGMNRAMINQAIPFRTTLMDSLLRETLPDLSFSFSPWEQVDSLMSESHWVQTGTLFSPQITYYYAYSPFQREGICVEAPLPSLPIFHRMAVQVALAFGLILLLIGCLVFQIKTILKQYKLGELRQHFVNTMIHELRRPVQTLKTFVSFLGDKEMRSDEALTGQIAQDAMFELDNLSAYLTQLKDMVRADNEETPLHISRFDLYALTEKVIRLTHIPQGKKVRFETRIKLDSPSIEADPIHVANVLSNLIENAIKYSGEEVVITISAHREANALWLTVADDGIGIPLVEQDKVFAKFYRGSNLPDVNLPGLGLGLSYVKLISEAHRGSVSLRSQLGEGTSVTLYLPQ